MRDFLCKIIWSCENNVLYLRIKFIIMVIEKQIDELTKEKFTFTIFNNNILVLDSYYYLSRENTRKRTWNTVRNYERLSGRSSRITLEQVPFTEEIKKEILEQYVKTLKVMTWTEYKR